MIVEKTIMFLLMPYNDAFTNGQKIYVPMGQWKELAEMNRNAIIAYQNEYRREIASSWNGSLFRFLVYYSFSSRYRYRVTVAAYRKYINTIRIGLGFVQTSTIVQIIKKIRYKHLIFKKLHIIMSDLRPAYSRLRNGS